MNGRVAKRLRVLADMVTVNWPDVNYVTPDGYKIMLGKCTRRIYKGMKKKYKADPSKYRQEHHV